MYYAVQVQHVLGPHLIGIDIVVDGVKQHTLYFAR